MRQLAKFLHEKNVESAIERVREQLRPGFPLAGLVEVLASDSPALAIAICAKVRELAAAVRINRCSHGLIMRRFRRRETSLECSRGRCVTAYN